MGKTPITASLLVIALGLVLVATGCSSETGAPGISPTAITTPPVSPTPISTPEFALTSDDLKCSPSRARRSAWTDFEVQQVDFTVNAVEAQVTPAPLSTPTAAPGRTVTTAYANIVGGDTSCFLIGSIGNLFIGGTHDLDEPMLLRFTITIPPGLTLLDPDHAPPVVDGVHIQEFEMGSSRDSGSHSLKFTSDTPGAYEVDVVAEWFRQSSMTPYTDLRWPGQRTFIFYAVTE